MKLLSKTLLVLAVASFIFASCSKEARLGKDIEGTWNVTKATSNGDDVTAFFTSIVFTFNEYDKGESQGTTSLTMTDAIFNDTETFTGEYEINEDATQLDFVTDSLTTTFDVTLEDDNLTLSGDMDGDAAVFEATRQ